MRLHTPSKRKISAKKYVVLVIQVLPQSKEPNRHDGKAFRIRMKDIDRTKLYHNSFMDIEISFTGSIVLRVPHICTSNATLMHYATAACAVLETRCDGLDCIYHIELHGGAG